MLAFVVTTACDPAFAAAAVQFELIKIAGDDTPLPDRPDQVFRTINFQNVITKEGATQFSVVSFGPFPQVLGVYEWTAAGGLRHVVDSSAPEFGASGPTILSVSLGDFDGDTTTVGALNSITERRAIYTVTSGAIHEVVSSDVTDPSTGEPFEVVSGGRLAGDTLFFAGGDFSGPRAIYKIPVAGGAPVALVDQNTPFPGLSFQPTAFEPGEEDGGLLSFRAAASPGATPRGVYVTDVDGNVTPLMERGAAAPNGINSFNHFGGALSHPSLHDGKAAFAAFDTVTGPVYSAIVVADAITGDTTVIADNTMDLPGRPQGVSDFQVTSPMIHGESVVFLGSVLSRGAVLYLHHEGQVQDLLHIGDTLDGKQIESLELSPYAFDGEFIAVGVNFTDNSDALYSIRIVPSPPAAVLLASAGLALGRRQRQV